MTNLMPLPAEHQAMQSFPPKSAVACCLSRHVLGAPAQQGTRHQVASSPVTLLCFAPFAVLCFRGEQAQWKVLVVLMRVEEALLYLVLQALQT